MRQPITLKLYALKRRQKPNGEIPIYLRMTKNRKYKLLSTGISVQGKFWNPAGYIKKSHLRSNILNQHLEDILFNARETLRRLPDEKQTLTALREALISPERKQFFIYAKQYVKTLFEDNRYWAGKRTEAAINHFSNFIGNETITLDEVTSATLKRFQAYLIHDKNRKPNTVNKVFECIKGVFRDAKENEVTGNDPFQSFRPVSRVNSDKTRLSAKQIRAIENLKLKHGTFRCIIRDAFLFSFYNAGIRFSDICTLQWERIVDGRLQYNMAKTGGRKNINLIEPALKILKRYRLDDSGPKDRIFPILSLDKDYSDPNFLRKQISVKNVLANRELGKIAKLAGIEEKVTFHVSRHSFADYARSSKMSIYDISKALGHADLETTEKYLKSFDEFSLDEGMNRLFLQEEKK